MRICACTTTLANCRLDAVGDLGERARRGCGGEEGVVSIKSVTSFRLFLQLSSIDAMEL